jgi:hypothetical protein
MDPAETHVTAQPAPPAGAGSRQRVAWFVAGAVASFAFLMLLGPVVATPAPQESGVVRPVPMGASGMSADSNNRMIAVTGVDITGQSVLYVIDSVNPHLAVYQASGGTAGTQNIKLVAARRIDLDLQLNGFNDETTLDGRPLTYEDLEARFDSEVEDR